MRYGQGPNTGYIEPFKQLYKAMGPEKGYIRLHRALLQDEAGGDGVEAPDWAEASDKAVGRAAGAEPMAPATTQPMPSGTMSWVSQPPPTNLFGLNIENIIHACF